MADTVSIILDTIDSSLKKRQKAITNISPTATNADLYTFANAFNALSTDTLEKVTRIQKQEINNQPEIIGNNYMYTAYYNNIDDTFIAESYSLRVNGNIVQATWNFVPENMPTQVVPSYGYGSRKISYISLSVDSNLTEKVTAYVDITAVYNEQSYTKRVQIDIYPAQS